MNIKIECIKLALDYAKYWTEQEKHHYKSSTGIIEIAKEFYDFAKDNQS